MPLGQATQFDLPLRFFSFPDFDDQERTCPFLVFFSFLLYAQTTHHTPFLPFRSPFLLPLFAHTPPFRSCFPHFFVHTTSVGADREKQKECWKDTSADRPRGVPIDHTRNPGAEQRGLALDRHFFLPCGA